MLILLLLALYRVGSAFKLLSYICYICSLIFLAKGFGINRKYVSKSGVLKIVFYATVFYITLLCSDSYTSWILDLPTPMVRFQTLPSELRISNGILAGQSVVAWLWFSFATYTTSINFPTKKSKY